MEGVLEISRAGGSGHHGQLVVDTMARGGCRLRMSQMVHSSVDLDKAPNPFQSIWVSFDKLRCLLAHKSHGREREIDTRCIEHIRWELNDFIMHSHQPNLRKPKPIYLSCQRYIWKTICHIQQISLT